MPRGPPVARIARTAFEMALCVARRWVAALRDGVIRGSSAGRSRLLELEVTRRQYPRRHGSQHGFWNRSNGRRRRNRR
jgi:hypothetical protein